MTRPTQLLTCPPGPRRGPGPGHLADLCLSQASAGTLRRGLGDQGAASAPLIVAVGLLALALVTFVNLATWHYGSGALRAAADQAARAGSRASASPATCQERAHEALDALLGGSLATDITVTCSETDGRAHASLTATFTGWVELVPDRTITVTASAVKEQAP